MTPDIWIFCDSRTTDSFDASLNLLKGAETLSSQKNADRVVVIFSLEADEDSPDTASLIRRSFEHGADRVMVLDTGGQESIPPASAAAALAFVIEEHQPVLVLFPLFDVVREICTRAACRLNAGVISEATRLYDRDGAIMALCPSYGGTVLAELGFTDPGRTGFVSMHTNAFVREPLEAAREPRVEHLKIAVPGVDPTFRRISRTRRKLSPGSLETARRVVVGGAGLGNAEGFRKVRQLAAALGADVGATRPPVLWHWVDEERLIGQTGKSIQPDLLVSVGTSGAVQYTAGITGSGLIVAVNRDPEAPIFKIADIGVVADAGRFLPLLTEEIYKLSMKSLSDAVGQEGKDGSASDVGSRLLGLRKSHGFTQEQLAERSGHTPEMIRDIEENRTTPSVGFLIKLAEILGIDPGIFLSDERRGELTGKRAKEYSIRTSNYYYQTLTPGAENEHLRVFMVTIESRRQHRSVAYRHEGEEFVFVMEGKLELVLENRVHVLMQGEYMKFNSQTPHRLKSLSDHETRCLVALYTP